MEKVKAYSIFCDVYSDTRMGASNPSFTLGNPVLSLESAKKKIIKYLKGKNRKIPEFDIKLKYKKWTMDFNPEIITVSEISIK
jgi:hypothetical protein